MATTSVTIKRTARQGQVIEVGQRISPRRLFPVLVRAHWLQEAILGQGVLCEASDIRVGHGLVTVVYGMSYECEVRIRARGVPARTIRLAVAHS